MHAAVAAVLPRGLWVGGTRRRDAGLRPLTGADEEFLCGAAAGLAPAERVTALLARCLESLGPHTPPEPEAIRALAVGDREALLLQLRRITLGDRMDVLLTCPQCGELMDFELQVGDLLVAPYADAPEVHAADVGERRVRFRPVTGADQEAAACGAAEDLDGAVRLVLERCLQPPAEPSPLLLEALPALLAGADPQADIVLDVGCEACGERTTVRFDTAAFLERELAQHEADLYREVHALASHYHWSEAELLALPPGKRRRYLELVADGGDWS